MLTAESSMEEINNLKGRLSLEFKMKDLDAAKQILGMRISRDRSTRILNLSQMQYIEKVLSRFKVDDVKPRNTPLANHLKLSNEQSPKTAMERDHMVKAHYASAVGSLMYDMVCTRPHIAHVMGAMSRYMSDPGKEYLKGAVSTSLCYGNGKVVLEDFVDADLSGDMDTSKSTSEYVYTIDETAVNWMFKLQKCVFMSSTEAKYVAIAEAELGKKQLDKVLFIDSQSVIQLVKNPVYHFRIKHIQHRYYFTRSLMEEGEMCLKKIEGTKNPADILTKGIDAKKLGLYKTSVGFLQ
ncbi:hypothetical protein MANES_02G210760v8 [Manihot esculenta]|uniref:Uncharacterized protein n=1 Tax=Manihot esculenta TaxID=3983 RepID=A0ACB7I8H0_MANES|nr:hypothetical protein MANES_02G210760v8 [Manihot esculenta]